MIPILRRFRARSIILLLPLLLGLALAQSGALAQVSLPPTGALYLREPLLRRKCA